MKFIKERKIPEELSCFLIKEIKEAEREIKRGEVSPVFDNAKDAIKWLKNASRKYYK